jgi:hypothetical protein
MALYFFHHRRNFAYIRDHEGSECCNLEEARWEAILSARELMGASIAKGFVDFAASFEIEGPAGQRAVLLFSEAVEIRR